MAETISIPARFNGPPGSANGGYTCGLVAGLLGGGAAEVSLRAPPPLDTPLAVERDDSGVRLLAGETLVAEGRPAEVDVEPPAPVGLDEARAAASAGYELWAGAHPFPTCFVCGPKREEGDGLRIFPGDLRDGLWAAAWTAPGEGPVAPEIVWSALDCPTSAPVMNVGGSGPPCVLARLSARLDAPVEGGGRYALVSWPLAVDGRKRHAGCVLMDGGGQVLARARALWIELRQ